MLVGCGIIAFVAANWAAIPDVAKAVLLNAGVVGLYLAGHYLWFKKNLPAFGHSLMFAGALAFGADLALMAQNFNFSLPHYGGYGIWAIGTLCVAVCVRSLPLTVLSLIGGTVWLSSAIDELPPVANLARFAVAALALVAAGRIAHMSWLYRLAAICGAIGFLQFISQTTESDGFIAVGFLALAALAGTVGLWLRGREESHRAGVGAILLGWITAGLTSFIVASASVSALSPDFSWRTAERLGRDWAQGAWLIGITAFAALVIATLVVRRARWADIALACGAVATQIAISCAAIAPHIHLSETWSATLAVSANMAFAAILFATFSSTGLSERLALGTFALLGAGGVLMAFAGAAETHQSASVLLAALAGMALIPALGRATAAWSNRNEPETSTATVGWVLLAGAAFVAAFHDTWFPESAPGTRLDIWNGSIAVIGAVLAACVVLAFLSIRRPIPDAGTRRLVTGLISCWALLILACILSMTGASEVLTTALSILAALGVGACFVAAGLAQERRQLYWLGSAYLVAVVLMRFFEYQTTPLVKSLAFLTSGVVILVAGAFFERRHRRGEAGHAGSV